jgi:REP element-mobilizing transposase RayT
MICKPRANRVARTRSYVLRQESRVVGWAKRSVPTNVRHDRSRHAELSPSGRHLIKSAFSRGIDTRPRSPGKISKREKGIWQRRYWEHAIRDDSDLERHVDYIHFNPVKHGHVARVADWPHSSFHRHVERGFLAADWGGDMKDIQGPFGE